MQETISTTGLLTGCFYLCLQNVVWLEVSQAYLFATISRWPTQLSDSFKNQKFKDFFSLFASACSDYFNYKDTKNLLIIFVNILKVWNMALFCWNIWFWHHSLHFLHIILQSLRGRSKCLPLSQKKRHRTHTAKGWIRFGGRRDWRERKNAQKYSNGNEEITASAHVEDIKDESYDLPFLFFCFLCFICFQGVDYGLHLAWLIIVCSLGENTYAVCC